MIQWNLEKQRIELIVRTTQTYNANLREIAHNETISTEILCIDYITPVIWIYVCQNKMLETFYKI